MDLKSVRKRYKMEGKSEMYSHTLLLIEFLSVRMVGSFDPYRKPTDRILRFDDLMRNNNKQDGRITIN